MTVRFNSFLRAVRYRPALADGPRGAKSPTPRDSANNLARVARGNWWPRVRSHVTCPVASSATFTLRVISRTALSFFVENSHAAERQGSRRTNPKASLIGELDRGGS